MFQVNVQHDTIVLMSAVHWNRSSGGILGLAWRNGLCKQQYSAAIVTDLYSQSYYTEWVLAHEIGHNLGFLHVQEVAGCTCKRDGFCIMNSYAPWNSPHRVLDWSSCTVDAWRSQANALWRSCLANAPEKSYYTGRNSQCGNGILETGEQCDCGPPETCASSCCNASTCRLNIGAACASGPCCDWGNCSLTARGDVCRPASGPCDVPETCSGVSEWCPSDDKMADGVDCASGQAFCYNGQCKTADAQCQLMFSSSATTGSDICYSYANVRGNLYGHCDKQLIGGSYVPGYGFNLSYSYTACSSANFECGLLHCFESTKPTVSGVAWYNFSSIGFVCYSQPLHDLSSSGMRNPGFVPDGAKCGTSSMCINSACTPLSTVRSCPTCPNCNNNGVLTRSKLCFCNAGFQPPDCALSGCGGSATSPLACLGLPQTSKSLPTSAPTPFSQSTSAAFTSSTKDSSTQRTTSTMVTTRVQTEKRSTSLTTVPPRSGTDSTSHSTNSAVQQKTTNQLTSTPLSTSFGSSTSTTPSTRSSISSPRTLSTATPRSSGSSSASNKIFGLDTWLFATIVSVACTVPSVIIAIIVLLVKRLQTGAATGKPQVYLHSPP